MSNVVYADTLLLVNFSMDFLALFICAKITGTKIFVNRIVASALLGAIWALIATIAELTSDFNIILTSLLSIVCAVIMIKLSFGGNIYTVFKGLVTYLAVNIGIGGVMTAVFSFIGKIIDGANVYDRAAENSPVVFIISAVIAGFVSLVYGKFKNEDITKKHIKVYFEIMNNKFELIMLVDSGNLLREPYLQKPVIILSHNALKELLPNSLIEAAKSLDNMIEYQRKSKIPIRLIPTESVAGQNMLLGLVPEMISIEGRSIDAVVAIDSVNTDYDGCGGLIPQTLLTI